MQIDIIHTSCKNCVFAKFNKDTQIGCELGYIDIYKKSTNGPDVLEVYDESKEFFVINKKKCLGYRENTWFDQYGDKPLSIQDKIDLYFKHNKISYILIINLKNLNQISLENIISDIKNLSIKPEKIVLVRYPPKNSELIFPYEYIKNILDHTNIQWKIQTVVDSNIAYEFMLHNIVSTNKQYRFVASINQYTHELSKIIDYANDLVCKNLQSFEIIANRDKSCLIFPSIVYRYSMFMYKQNILSNIDGYIYI